MPPLPITPTRRYLSLIVLPMGEASSTSTSSSTADPGEESADFLHFLRLFPSVTDLWRASIQKPLRAAAHATRSATCLERVLPEKTVEHSSQKVLRAF